jgi:hypothetical protein
MSSRVERCHQREKAPELKRNLRRAPGALEGDPGRRAWHAEADVVCAEQGMGKLLGFWDRLMRHSVTPNGFGVKGCLLDVLAPSRGGQRGGGSVPDARTLRHPFPEIRTLHCNFKTLVFKINRTYFKVNDIIVG